MISKRLLAQLPIIVSILTTAALLIWANRGGAARLVATSVFLSGTFMTLLALYGTRGTSYDWPFWGTLVVVIVTVFGTALTVRYFGSRGMHPFLSMVTATLTATALYIGAYTLLMILFPGRFWI